MLTNNTYHYRLLKTISLSDTPAQSKAQTRSDKTKGVSRQFEQYQIITYLDVK